RAARDPWRDLARAKPEQRPVMLEGASMVAARGGCPVELRVEEGLLGVRVGDRLRACRRARERGELAPPAFAHRAGEIALEIAEVQERSERAELLAHEEELHRGSEQQRRGGEPDARGRCERSQPLAERAVA